MAGTPDPSSDVSADPPVGYKRTRVSKACHSCRSLKAKCDGKRPMCSRCRGYDYECIYGAGPARRRFKKASSHPNQGPSTSLDALSPRDTVAPEDVEALRRAMAHYDQITEELLGKMGDGALSADLLARKQQASSEAATVLTRLAESGSRNEQLRVPKLESEPTAGLDDHARTAQPCRSPRYLGEVSDLQFFNRVKRVLQNHNGLAQTLDEVEDSYDQDQDLILPNSQVVKNLDLATLEGAPSFVEVYFSTIHLAYPFLQQSQFLRTFEEIRSSKSDSFVTDRNALALTYTICAIGSYYTSFTSNGQIQGREHELLYLRGLSLAHPPGVDSSITQCSVLLAQCFYLLAVSRIDSCWITLGQAIRIAQSLGLHVEHERQDRPQKKNSLKYEKRRRMWYSMYVLDRLLALQLGRPPAIHDDDCLVPLPSRIPDAQIRWNAPAPVDLITVEAESEGDYFLAVIEFSQFVGQVLRDIYGPGGNHGMPQNFESTKKLDRQLLRWKLELPRMLRFDLGHTFEQSFVFKRQRNMLAIKFHHLRALIHRPYLCHPFFLRQHNDNYAASVPERDWPLISSFEKTCIMEARETARLLHGISDVKDLVHSFPWWQIISCLVCAASILLVSGIFMQSTEEHSSELEPDTLNDDAETCLRVFEALRTGSRGAQLARDMMEGLKKHGLTFRMATGSTRPTRSEGSRSVVSRSPATYGESELYDGATINPFNGPNVFTQAENPQLAAVAYPGPTNLMWPAELVDSMTWSAQFFEHNVQNS